MWALSLLLLSRGGLFRLELLGFRFELLVMLQVLGVFVEPVGEVLDRIPWTPICDLSTVKLFGQCILLRINHD